MSGRFMSGKIGANTQVKFCGRLIFIPEFSLTHSVDGIVKLFWQNFCKQLPTNFGLYILLLSLVTVIDFSLTFDEALPALQS